MLPEQLHVQVAFRAPLGSGYMSEPSRTEHEGGMTVGERANNPGPSPDLFHYPFKAIICPDPNSVRSGKVVV